MNLYLSFVCMFDGSCTDTLFENERLIAETNELVDINTIAKSDEHDISPFRASLDTDEVIGFDLESSEESLNFFRIQRTSISFIIF